jgi:hypothetical protein
MQGQSPKTRAAVIGAVAIAVLGALTGAVIAFRIVAIWWRWTVASIRTARFGWRLATLRAYRRCPDCFSVRRREAKVCGRCGARIGSR